MMVRAGKKEEDSIKFREEKRNIRLISIYKKCLESFFFFTQFLFFAETMMEEALADKADCNMVAGQSFNCPLYYLTCRLHEVDVIHFVIN